MGRSVCADCSVKTTGRVRSPSQCGVESTFSWPGWTQSFLVDPEGHRRTHREVRGGAKGLHGPFDLGSEKGKDCILVTL